MRKLLPGAALLAACLLPFIPGVPLYWLTLANAVGIAAIVTIGLVVLTGIGGMTSFGQASFLGFGAYATALLTTAWGWSPWLSLPVSLAASGAAAMLIGAVTLRLRGHYLALGTIAWSISLYYTFGNLDLVGRNDGIPGIPPITIAGFSLIDPRGYCVLVWLAVLLAVRLTRNLLDSRTGRTIRALQGGAIAAESFGVGTTRARLIAFVYAAVLAGLAGWLYAHMQRSVNPTPFGLNASIDYLLMAVAGGAAHIPGALLGAALVTLVNDRLQDVLPLLFGAQGNYETIVFGTLLVLLLQVAPEGIWPHLARRGRSAPRIAVTDGAAASARTMPARGTTLLEVTGLRRRFGGLVAVNDLSFTIAAGEIVGLIGPNGAGKSTSFNLLTGVDRPDGGALSFAGAPLPAGARDVARCGIARTFQHVRLVAAMSALENVAIGAHLRGRAGVLPALLRLDRGEEARLFAEAARQLARVGLGREMHHPATELALGQQRVVEIARALCLDPVLLLLDEPAAGLRHAEKQRLAALLTQLRREGMTILLVEHDMEFVMGLVDRLVVMDFGTRIAAGVPDAVAADPVVIEAYLGAPG